MTGRRAGRWSRYKLLSSGAVAGVSKEDEENDDDDNGEGREVRDSS